MSAGVQDHLPPVVRLRNHFHRPYDHAIAAARTCYASEVVQADQITEKQRDLIGPFTFEAGHHTVFQHAMFEFSLENVSRHFVGAVLHSFPFYNSEQQSQRYVRLDQMRAFVPPLPQTEEKIFRGILEDAHETYQELGEILKRDTLPIVSRLRAVDRHPRPKLAKQVEQEAEKKALEVARYVLPIATHTSLIYTCSGLVLHRLRRLAQGGDCPSEALPIIEEMIRRVEEVDPHFFTKVGAPPLEPTEMIEGRFLEASMESSGETSWDQQLDPYHFSKLMEHTGRADRMISDSVRMTLGGSAATLDPQSAIELVLNPKKNRYRVEALNLATHSPLMRSLNHVHYTFLKRISLSADAQNQRHRMVPGSRPLLQLIDSREVDAYVPMLIQRNRQALDTYTHFLDRLWKTKNHLLDKGLPKEFAVYLLPNAARIRFLESGSLLHLMHKWTQRTCLNAQEEIFHASMEELEQVRRVHPFLSDHLGPPCVVRNGVVSPRCTEGKKYCGVPVWNQFPKVNRDL